MAFNLASLQSYLTSGKDLIKKQTARFKQKDMLERMSIVASLVAYCPDQNASDKEINMAVQAMFVQSDGVFDIDEMMKLVKARVDKLKSFGVDLGKLQFYKDLGKPNEQDARLLIMMAITIAKSEGDPGQDPFSPAEKAVVSEIARQMSINPADFGL
jgi:tellurite resistance protein TerB